MSTASRAHAHAHARARVGRTRVGAQVSALAALVAGALLGLAGCASGTTPSIDSAVAADRYEPVMVELLSVLEESYPGVSWTADGESRVASDGDGCVFVVGTQRGDPSLPESAGGWEALAEVVDPVLDGRGFGEASEVQSFDGGWTGVLAGDDAGAELRLSDKGHTLLQLSVPVTDEDC